FADRTQLAVLINEIQNIIHELLESYKYGNVLKNGVPTVIVGRPNAGKSTLLNALLNDERAIVSEIEGTTRDTIEEEFNINGIIFRFIDTAGIRDSKDTIEKIGIKKTKEKISQASLIIYIYDAKNISQSQLNKDLKELNSKNKPLLIVANKTDLIQNPNGIPIGHIQISAKNKLNINHLKDNIFNLIVKKEINTSGLIITNERHYNLLSKAAESLDNILVGLQGQIPGDLIAMDIRQANFYLGEITGTITTDDLLGNIFGKFCIGK
ncbi:MAG TPA: GTP-binding protein, partial [Bacteroidetes bacterium]|nr:GTP-binding protein [Bacteroidota bacterium]